MIETAGLSRGAGIGRYVGFYNGRRLHSALYGATPDTVYFSEIRLVDHNDRTHCCIYQPVRDCLIDVKALTAEMNVARQAIDALDAALHPCLAGQRTPQLG